MFGKLIYCLECFQRKKKAGSSDEDADIMSGSDIDIPVSVAPRADRPGRRQATKKINYSGLLESEEEQSSEGELVFNDNDAVKAPTHKTTKMSDADSDSDCVVQSEEPADSPIRPKSKPSVKRPRKTKSSDSEDDKKVRSLCIHSKRTIK